jgi:membrane protein YdbS with pleckstrin-like domain
LNNQEEFPREYLVEGEEVVHEFKPVMIMYFPKPLLFILLGVLGSTILWTGIYSLQTVPESFNFMPMVMGGVLLIITLYLYPMAFAISTGLFALLFTAFHGFNFSSMIEMNLDILMLSLVLGLLLGGVIGFFLRYQEWKRTTYALTNMRVRAAYGAFSRIVAACTYDKIQTISLTQSFLEERLKFGTLTFSTASTAGGTGLIGRGRGNIPAAGAIVWRSIENPIKTYVMMENSVGKT